MFSFRIGSGCRHTEGEADLFNCAVLRLRLVLGFGQIFLEDDRLKVVVVPIEIYQQSFRKTPLAPRATNARNKPGLGNLSGS
jgi:hypothetical protein